MGEIFIKCTIDPKYWNEKQDEAKQIAARSGVMYKQKPVSIHYVGSIYNFNPECELPYFVAKTLSTKRWYIKMVGEPYDKTVEWCDPTDAQEEDENKYGEVYLCKYCGWPFPRVRSRNMHEQRWCKRKE
jgi:hypothetical protein